MTGSTPVLRDRLDILRDRQPVTDNGMGRIIYYDRIRVGMDEIIAVALVAIGTAAAIGRSQYARQTQGTP